MLFSFMDLLIKNVVYEEIRVRRDTREDGWLEEADTD